MYVHNLFYNFNMSKYTVVNKLTSFLLCGSVFAISYSFIHNNTNINKAQNTLL